MNYKEQCNWLRNNGFIDIATCQQNMIIWERKLEDEKILQFEWYNGGGTWEPSWTIGIHTGQDNLIILIDSIHDDENFSKFQPLIDLIR